MKGIVIIATVFLVLQLVAFRTANGNYSGNYCLSFPYNSTGTGDYVNLGSSAIYEAAKFTIEAWIKPTFDIHAGSDSNYTHASGKVASRYISAGYYDYEGWVLQFNYADGMLYLYILYGSHSYELVSYHTNRAFWNSSSWYQIAVTYDPTLSSNNLIFYVNGSIDSQHSETKTIYYYNAPLIVGADSFNIGVQYGGLIDEFRYWNVSRTQAEIQNAWNRTLDTSLAERGNPNLVGYWRFDDGSGQYAQDYSLYGNVGSLLPSSSPPQWSSGAPIRFSLIGDLNHDGRVDMKDIGMASRAFGTKIGDTNFNPFVDITGQNGVPDGKVDMRDISTTAKNFGKTDP